MKPLRLSLLLAVNLLSAVGAAAAPADPGIFAVFQTNRGAFVCELFFEDAPMTVANFVGLAEGTRPFIDPAAGLVKRPFYDGLTFHRVIKNFMIQGGSPNGQGTDGPGYQFGNEFSTGRLHNKAGVLSMANAGPDTNGSQFFITVAPTPHLDFKHSVFGEVVEGMDTVFAISQTETGNNDRPIDPVIIETIEIVRNGADAEAFDVDSQRLPKLNTLTPTMTMDPLPALQFPRRIYQQEVLFVSSDLQTWTPHPLPFHTTAPADSSLDLSAITLGKSRQFFRLAVIEYGYVAAKIVGKRLTLNSESHDLSFVLNFETDRAESPDAPWLGTGSFNGEEVPRDLDYLYFQDPVSGRVLFVLSGLVQINAFLQFETETSGTFSAIVDPAASAWGFYGGFTLENFP